MKPLYAVYSKRQKELAGFLIYKKADGTEGECTDISFDPGVPSCEWTDKINLGEIIEVRQGEYWDKALLKQPYNKSLNLT